MVKEMLFKRCGDVLRLEVRKMCTQYINYFVAINTSRLKRLWSNFPTVSKAGSRSGRNYNEG